MNGDWIRARAAYLQTGTGVLALGFVIGIGGLFDGEPLALPLAVGAMALINAALLLFLDRIYRGLERRERRLLLWAFVVSLGAYVALLVVGGDQDGDTLLLIAGAPGIATGALAVWLGWSHKQ
jgi:hypothetical protein